MTLHIFTYVHELDPFIVHLPTVEIKFASALMLNSKKAGCRRLCPPLFWQKSLKKIKVCLKKCHFATFISWSMVCYWTVNTSVCYTAPDVTRFPDSVSFGHMDSHTLTHSHTHEHLCRNTDIHRWKEKIKSGKTKLWPVGTVPFEEFICCD